MGFHSTDIVQNLVQSELGTQSTMVYFSELGCKNVSSCCCFGTVDTIFMFAYG